MRRGIDVVLYTAVLCTGICWIQRYLLGEITLRATGTFRFLRAAQCTSAVQLTYSLTG